MTDHPESTAVSGGGHTPVMLREVLRALEPRDGAIYVDGTFGAGGYASAILDSADCRLWGIDRDRQAVARAAALVRRYGERLKVLHGRFGVMDRLMGEQGVTAVDGIALDLGVSSMQLGAAERGFSFQVDGPLDMRMDADGAEAGPSAAEVVNTLSEGELATVIARYGEERKARHVARAIVTARRERRIERTAHLADIVRRAVRRGVKAGRPRIDPATRTFQALRIYVNDELGELERGLHAAERLLAPSGRLAVVAFHSLEDRVVKAFLRERGRARPRGSRHLPESGEDRRNPTFLPLHRGTCRPSRAECTTNPRARSARLRAAERTEFPPWTARGGTA
ncbi:MAG: 16S rRNA (cytosine(1402)-N(4))-methyltransferase RsmH [Kiloniellales bacterium]